MIVVLYPIQCWGAGAGAGEKKVPDPQHCDAIQIRQPA